MVNNLQEGMRARLTAPKNKTAAPVPWDLRLPFAYPRYLYFLALQTPLIRSRLFFSVMVTSNHTFCECRSRSGRVVGALFSSSELSTVTSSLSAVVFNISACASSTNGEVPCCLAVGKIVCRSQCMTKATKNP